MIISKKKIVVNSIVYTFLPKVSFIASILILPLISPYLTLIDYAVYGLIVAYISIFQILIVLGQNVVLQNSFFEYREKYQPVWKRSFGLMIIGGLLSTVLFTVILYYFHYEELLGTFWPVSLMVGVFLVLSPIDTIAINYFTLKELPFPYAIGAAVSGLFATFVTLLTIKYLNYGFLGWVISMPLSVVIKYIYYSRILFVHERIFPHFLLKKRFLKKAVGIGLPLAPHQLSLYVLGTSDRLLLQYFKVPMSDIGIFSQGYNLGSNASIFINGIFQALSKNLQESFRGSEDFHRAFLRKLIFLTPLGISLFLFVGSLWSKEVFLFLFRKPELQQGYYVTIVVFCSYMFWSIYTFFTYPLAIKNKTFSISKISLTAAVINIVGNIILIPNFGMWAALTTTYFSYLIFGIGGLMNKENRLFLNQFIDIKRLCLGMVFLNIILLLVSYLLKDSDVIIKGVVTLVTLFALLMLLYRLFPQSPLIKRFMRLVSLQF